ncbi:hypothetical protein [Legionella worsleiensis]|uniref:Transposase n=1 Tax=Legionella worsleiensis TaxID=45076 RepID=A0A0W1A9I4_9GAMM|nr:hypothetical protein [Legionella worsleiensis]KTD77981.1 hypothetical protein Lwor_1863 [Legionella worsleiensis]STY31554.1 transposase [Legionella worsleiensis]
MHIQELLHGILSKALSHIHIKRIKALVNAVQSLLHGKKLSLTRLDRTMRGSAKERHRIRKMDRLLRLWCIAHIITASGSGCFNNVFGL